MELETSRDSSKLKFKDPNKDTPIRVNLVKKQDLMYEKEQKDINHRNVLRTFRDLVCQHYRQESKKFEFTYEVNQSEYKKAFLELDTDNIYYRLLNLWENPPYGSTFRYIDASKPHFRVSDKIYVHETTPTFIIGRKKLGDKRYKKIMVPRYLKIFIVVTVV
jgi:hypothetical protein